jgi:hypothetical protein
MSSSMLALRIFLMNVATLSRTSLWSFVLATLRCVVRLTKLDQQMSLR